MSGAAGISRGLALFQATACCASAVLIAVLLTPVPVQVRFLVAVVFVAFGPGTALLSVLGSRFADSAGVGIVVALGMAIVALLSQLIMWSGQFDARTDLVVAAVVVMGVIAGAWLRRRSGTGRSRSTSTSADASRGDGTRPSEPEQPIRVGEGR